MATKLTWFYEYGKFGWSESLFSQLPKEAEELEKQALKYTDLRLKIGGYPVSAPYIRMSDDRVNGESVVVTTPYGTVAPVDRPNVNDWGVSSLVTPVMDGKIDRPYSALLLRCDGTPGASPKMMYIRGIPDKLVEAEQFPKADEPWTKAFDAWVKHVTKNFFFKSLDKDPVRNAPKKIVNMAPSVAGAGLPTEMTLTVPNHGLVAGDIINVTGVKVAVGKSVKGNFRVFRVNDANSFNINLKEAQLAFAYIPNSGSYQQQKSNLFRLEKMQIRGLVSRRTGRPFDSPRGRRSKKPVA